MERVRGRGMLSQPCTPCPSCGGKLRYVHLNMDELVLTCESMQCLYPWNTSQDDSQLFVSPGAEVLLPTALSSSSAVYVAEVHVAESPSGCSSEPEKQTAVAPCSIRENDDELDRLGDFLMQSTPDPSPALGPSQPGSLPPPLACAAMACTGGGGGSLGPHSGVGEGIASGMLPMLQGAQEYGNH